MPSSMVTVRTVLFNIHFFSKKACFYAHFGKDPVSRMQKLGIRI